jgi:SAM-dependent methyltransferase
MNLEGFNRLVRSIVIRHKLVQIVDLLKKDDLVMDVGCGDRPLSRADVLCDLHMKSNCERGGPIPTDGRPFVVCDAQHLPFRDKAFAFANCCHVLEHLPNPKLGVRELMRVAQAGYIETPTLTREMLSRWVFHRWIVKYEQDKLVFLPNTFPAHDLLHFLSNKFLAWRFLYGTFDELCSFFTLRVYFDSLGLHRL